MKIHLKLILCLYAIFNLNLSFAQKVEYSKGNAYKHDGINLEYIGKSDQFIFYIGQKWGEEIEYILKADIKTLNIIEKISPSKFKIKGKTVSILALDNELLFFALEPLKTKKGVLNSTLKVSVFDANGQNKERKEFILTEIQEEESDFFYHKELNVFVVYNQDVIHYFGRDYKPLPSKSPLIKDPLTINTKSIIFNSFTDNGPKTEKKFFYLIKMHAGIRYFAKADFVPTERCTLSLGHIQNLEITTYDTFTNFRKDVYKFDIREESYLLDYTVSIDEDGRVIIIGIYQDKEFKDAKVHLGLFSKILEPDLREKIPTFYIEMTGQDEFIHGYSNFKPYSIQKMIFKNSYLNGGYSFICNHSGYNYLLVNRNNGFINFEKLNLPYICYKGSSTTGYLKKSHNDSIEWIFFNDHVSNIGKGANDSDLVGYDNKLDSLSFSFITFSSSIGFSKRQAIFDAGKEGFTLNFNYNEYYRGEVDSEGYFEIISPAYDIDKKNIKLYRFKVKI